MRLISLSVLALLLPLGASQAGAAETLYMYTENFPPYNMSINGRAFEHSADKIDGICMERVQAALNQSGYDYRIKLRNWNYGYNRALSKANHGIFCTTYTEDRAPMFKWVGPLAQNLWTIFAPAGSTFKMNRLEDAKGKTIGGYRNDVRSEYLLKRGYKVSVIDSDDLNPKRLALGQIDLWIAERLGGPYMASQQEIEGLVPVYSFNDVDLYLAMSPDTPDQVVEDLNNALETIRENGTYDAIGTKYGL
ncbi:MULTISPECIES: ABC transporter substrate-binding protein [unclassified Marinobacter]|uniref:substrate-binding periplasmic protein n=1 Tax=unclassified Marinobacter TaxID=83889 RepID=UPI0026E18956|nr:MULTISPECIES: transporter substrate-binding domain-containing protein [unclassified Marinobacter]MDO6441760.1 transporter substrate-binding domain-containing protein [Marinobacter sp. 2_MG-2023]MDO6824855.1 transporter substrate-binding domain-containing protein [Marinobacter sp. 1_MG-2023]